MALDPFADQLNLEVSEKQDELANNQQECAIYEEAIKEVEEERAKLDVEIVR